MTRRALAIVLICAVLPAINNAQDRPKELPKKSDAGEQVIPGGEQVIPGGQANPGEQVVPGGGPVIPGGPVIHPGETALPYGSGCVGQDAFACGCCPPKHTLWGSAEYLLWWLDDGPTPPLATTGDPNLAAAGALGQPGTRILFGGADLDFGTFSGGRLTLGLWLDDCQTFGVEWSGFLLENRGGPGFRSASDGAGNPPIYVPAIRAELDNEEGTFVISDPRRIFTGSLNITTESQLWGVEGNTVFRTPITPCDSFEFLLGFRHLNLEEDITLFGILGDPVLNVDNTYRESFTTENRFYGPQMGGRLKMSWDQLLVELSGKLALGVMHIEVDRQGFITQSGAGAPRTGTFPGAIFTQPTNVGSSSHDRFAVIPKVQAKVGWALTDNLRAFVAYDFLYASTVARPGDQIDRVVNKTQQAGGTLVGPARPIPIFNSDDFWPTA